jgi:hypothetical protein
VHFRGQPEFAPFDVVLGKPALIFSITNGPDDIFQGFIELVGPTNTPIQGSVQTDGARNMDPRGKPAQHQSDTYAQRLQKIIDTAPKPSPATSTPPDN